MKPVQPKTVLILGSGGLRIGQAGEFDYSGSQAIKALQQEGVKTILINPNIATVQTDQAMADRIYFLPLTSSFVERVIAKERPDALLLSFGGQTALNVGLQLERQGVLQRYRVAVLGTPTRAIRLTEDRKLFAQALRKINITVAKSAAVTTVTAGIKQAKTIGFPLVMRSAFSLGGEGSAVITNQTELIRRLREALATVPQVLIEEYLGGWKEIEYEVVRDRFDNCVTVCNMENVDPMGIHTGESIVVAPSQTLTNHEYHQLRSVAMIVVRSLGIVGECNIQFALDPRSDQYRVIEVNARLSRSSALASKATGYPLAWVAAKLALGHNLLEVKNSVTKTTTSCFEPALDYVAIKIPRWDLKKFKHADHTISTEMKSVGEVMAIGKTFTEALQKGLRMTSTGTQGLVGDHPAVKKFRSEIIQATDRRIYALATALQHGYTVEQLHQLSQIDRWFLYQLKTIVDFSEQLKTKPLTRTRLWQAKQLGFADDQIAHYSKQPSATVRQLRKRWQITPVIKQIDTLAGEYPANTNYLYLTYHGSEHDIVPGRKQIVVLGSGPYRIGSSVEFDWSCVQAVNTIKAQGYHSVVINCNPETVSTDYDICDRLYFEELSLERVLDIIDFEQPHGTIISMGGQVPNNLALDLQQHRVTILGTHPRDIDRAEDRNKFSKLLDRIGLDQPAWIEVTTLAAAKKFAQAVGYPVLIRPSYVLSGAAMNIAVSPKQLQQYLRVAATISKQHPVVISKFITEAREIEFDGVAQHGELKVYAMTEHVELAGVHSGDAHAVFPPQKTYLETIRRTKQRMRDVVQALNITGPFNIQFLAKNNDIKIIEINVRASRSFPFVSKSVKINFAEIATLAMLGKIASVDFKKFDLDYVTVKSPVFSYSRIKGADPVLYVEMGSTGEVAAFGDGYQEAILKSMLASGLDWPKKNILLSIGHDRDKAKLLSIVEKLHRQHRFQWYATAGTAAFLRKHQVSVKTVIKGRPVLELIRQRVVDFIVNIPHGHTHQEISHGFSIRRTAVDYHIPLISDVQLANAFLIAVSNLKESDLTIKAWDEY
ncbi:MAG: carbamoyl-phosphate synthase (glutamine-hydrolyzing) large subunit [Candidatus Kerfeldbacteria bacterium]|nr:carbamoyl-phosphate synthase (glutamine-hydrolyzing) large subunit [Candidatus Kerfeldbacteria bacterium]